VKVLERMEAGAEGGGVTDESGAGVGDHCYDRHCRLVQTPSVRVRVWLAEADGSTGAEGEEALGIIVRAMLVSYK
jgi:hypothetical protein